METHLVYSVKQCTIYTIYMVYTIHELLLLRAERALQHAHGHGELLFLRLELLSVLLEQLGLRQLVHGHKLR